MEKLCRPDGKKYLVLTIEDEELLRECTCEYLEDIGFETIQAENGLLGVGMVRAKHPDIVLTDLRMPEMNGLDVLAVIQKEFPDLPVIVISGTGTLQDVIQSLQLGAWDYILKPVLDNQIVRLSINRVLERKRLIDENKRYRIHLEEEVAQRTDELTKSIQRFRSLFNLAGDTIFIHDANGNILECNKQASSTLGYGVGELPHMSMQQLHEPSQRTMFEEKLNQLSVESGEMFETLFLAHDGTPVPVEVNACKIVMNENTQILSICRNISERKKAEAERHELENQVVAAQKMETLGLMASGIAHDFNNVLTALRGYAQLLRTKMGAVEGKSDYLMKINEIISMGQKLTGRITTFVRKDSEDLVTVDINSVLTDVESMLRPTCPGIRIALALHADASIVLADETQLQNAFLNLGINARDAMPDGGTLTFSTGNILTDNKKMLCIRVQDTGTGMDKDIITRIFDPLFTTKERGKGTGLGLTSVLYCIKNLHGAIDVASTPGCGTEFTITLPLAGAAGKN